MNSACLNPSADLANLIRSGRWILVHNIPILAQAELDKWIADVAEKLRHLFSNEIALEWEALQDFPILQFGKSFDDSVSWDQFRGSVTKRQKWLAKLPSRLTGQTERPYAEVNRFIHLGRIDELRNVGHSRFDLSKLVRLCEEINISFAANCHFAVAMLTRAVLDHVPPLFGCRTFAEVSDNYFGSKSFRDSMRNLQNSSRRIADHHLHCQIRSREVLPNAKQVDFSNDLDVLLAEVVRLGIPSSTNRESG